MGGFIDIAELQKAAKLKKQLDQQQLQQSNSSRTGSNNGGSGSGSASRAASVVSGGDSSSIRYQPHNYDTNNNNSNGNSDHGDGIRAQYQQHQGAVSGKKSGYMGGLFKRNNNNSNQSTSATNSTLQVNGMNNSHEYGPNHTNLHHHHQMNARYSNTEHTIVDGQLPSISAARSQLMQQTDTPHQQHQQHQQQQQQSGAVDFVYNSSVNNNNNNHHHTGVSGVQHRPLIADMATLSSNFNAHNPTNEYQARFENEQNRHVQMSSTKSGRSMTLPDTASIASTDTAGGSSNMMGGNASSNRGNEAVLDLKMLESLRKLKRQDAPAPQQPSGQAEPKKSGIFSSVFNRKKNGSANNQSDSPDQTPQPHQHHQQHQQHRRSSYGSDISIDDFKEDTMSMASDGAAQRDTSNSYDGDRNASGKKSSSKSKRSHDKQQHHQPQPQPQPQVSEGQLRQKLKNDRFFGMFLEGSRSNESEVQPQQPQAPHIPPINHEPQLQMQFHDHQRPAESIINSRRYSQESLRAPSFVSQAAPSIAPEHPWTPQQQSPQTDPAQTALARMAQLSLESSSHYKNMYAQLKQQPLAYNASSPAQPAYQPPPQPTVDPAMAALFGPTPTTQAASPQSPPSISPSIPVIHRSPSTARSLGQQQYPSASSSDIVDGSLQQQQQQAGPSPALAPGIRPPRRRNMGPGTPTFGSDPDGGAVPASPVQSTQPHPHPSKIMPSHLSSTNGYAPTMYKSVPAVAEPDSGFSEASVTSPTVTSPSSLVAKQLKQSQGVKELQAIFPDVPADTLLYYLTVADGNKTTAARMCMEDIKLAGVADVTV
ncbi:hypothetical protein GQ42DRAFT_162227 [Ramicandelaber brevisporus]|nr:hypothetical protein GQ42DRAFT_162227 [Ramicandelaber brevisporus]